MADVSNGAAAPPPPSAHDPPLPQHLNIVALETFFTPNPPLIVPAPHTFTLTEYSRTRPEEVLERIRDADIVITTVVPIRAATLAPESTPRLRMIVAVASGTDSIDVEACAARGVRVLNCPHCNTEALAEHVAALYLAARRTLVPVMRAMCAGEWQKRGSIMTTAYMPAAVPGAGEGQLEFVPPRSCRDETVAIVGYGGVGKAVARVLGALGMQVLVSGRRGASDAEQGAERDAGRVPFAEALRRATVLVVCCPLSPATRGLIGAPELARMRRDAILINVARGGIVGEAALVAALREQRLAGAGVDVFDREPASPETSPLVAAAAAGDVNLIVTAHTAWVSASTRANYQRALQENVERYIRGTVDAERIKA